MPECSFVLLPLPLFLIHGYDHTRVDLLSMFYGMLVFVCLFFFTGLVYTKVILIDRHSGEFYSKFISLFLLFYSSFLYSSNFFF